MQANLLKKNQKMRIQTIKLSKQDQQRLFYFGIYPGSIIKKVQEAPMNDPMIYQLYEHRMILRNEDASKIIGEVIE